MRRTPRLHPLAVTDTEPFTPSPQRPVRVRARSMPVDTHFEPHAHDWAQLAYCATGIVQVTAEQGHAPGEEVTYIVPPSRAVWIAPGACHHITVLEAAEFRTLYIDASATPAQWQGCRVMVVSPLLREAIAALDTLPAQPLPPAREQLLSALVLDEISRASTVALGVRLDGLLAPLLETQAQLTLKQPGHGAFTGTPVRCPSGQGGVLTGGAQHRLAQGAQSLVAAVGVRQRHAQRHRAGAGDFIEHQRAQQLFTRRGQRLSGQCVQRVQRGNRLAQQR